jgi:tetratricopeptide (TPR) repeat protein
MSSIVPGYEYDIFISYRQKDNKGDRWVSEFVDALKTELESTFKEEISVYFDINPHDGLLETHDVNASLKEKLKCIIFIPILSRTFCDPKSFAWEHEFKAFVDQASQDQFGLKVKLPNGNVANRVLPVRIHDLDNEDIKLCESVLGGVLRGIEFIYKEAGVNRPLLPKDNEEKNINKTNYRNQINKVALTVKEIVSGLKTGISSMVNEKTWLSKQSAEINKDERHTELKNPFKADMNKVLSGILVLAVLITIVLALPKIFKGRSNLRTMTMNVSVMNENGEREIRNVFKKGFITTLSVFPYVNESDNSLNNWLQYGINEAIWQDLYQFNYLSVGKNTSTHFQEQLKYALTNNYTYFLTGVFKVKNSTYEITSRLYQTSNGALKEERVFRGSDLFSLIDTVSFRTRIALDIPQSILGSFPDLPVKEQLTNNLDAFRFYIEGIYFKELESSSSLLGVNKAIELDSTFAMAFYVHALINYSYQTSYKSAIKYIKQAMRHRQRLSENDEISIRILSYLINGDTDRAVSLSEMQQQMKPANIESLIRLINTYQINLIVNKCEKAAEQLNELMPDQSEFMILLARCYLFSDKTDKGLMVLKNLLKDNPENTEALLQMGEIYLHKNDLKAAEEVYKKVLLINPEDEQYLSNIFRYIDYARSNSMDKNFLSPFSGNYRVETGEARCNMIISNNFLLFKPENQWAFFRYPISKDQNTKFDGSSTYTFSSNTQGIVVKMVHTSKRSVDSAILWKEDSLILKALKLSTNNNIPEALSSFQKAYEQNPEHYYLANFIKHLEFVQNQQYEKSKMVLESYIGRYGELRIYREYDQYYYIDNRGLIYMLLPLTDKEFMIPSMYNRIIQILKENNSIKGLKFIYRNGKEEYFPRNN